MRKRILRHIGQRTELLAAVSHDLRTPLTRMKLELEMLAHGKPAARRPRRPAQRRRGDGQRGRRLSGVRPRRGPGERSCRPTSARCCRRSPQRASTEQTRVEVELEKPGHPAAAPDRDPPLPDQPGPQRGALRQLGRRPGRRSGRSRLDRDRRRRPRASPRTSARRCSRRSTGSTGRATRAPAGSGSASPSRATSCSAMAATSSCRDAPEGGLARARAAAELAPGRRPAPPMTPAPPLLQRADAPPLDPRLGERGARAPARSPRASPSSGGAAAVDEEAVRDGLAGRAGDAARTPRRRSPSSRRSGSRSDAPPAAIVLGADQILSLRGPLVRASPATAPRRAPSSTRSPGAGTSSRPRSWRCAAAPGSGTTRASPGSGCGRARPAFLDAYLAAVGDAGAAPRSAPTSRGARGAAVRARSRATTSRSRACRCSRCSEFLREQGVLAR